jgi:hypothetical protein
MFALAGVYAQTIKPSGSYLEFGVYDGRTIALAFHTMATACDRFFAFDSFKGIGGATAQEQSHFANGQYYANLATLDYNLRFTGVDVARVTPVAGFFEDTLAGRTPRDYGIESASVVHIDTDVYAPALQALEFVTSALPQGALLLFDDYDQLAASNRKGERRAVREWLERHDDIELEEYRRYTPFSRAFIVHRT